MLFNYLPDKALVPLSNSQSYPKFYAYLLEKLLRDLFSLENDSDEMIDGSPTRNMVLKFIKLHLHKYAEMYLHNNEYPSNEKDAYDVIKSCGWIIEDNIAMSSYVVDMSTSMRALGEFLIDDFQSINQTENNTDITDGISGLLSSARSIMADETQDSDRLSQLRNTQQQVKKLAKNLNSIIKEIRLINKFNLETIEDRSSAEINNTFMADFEKLVIKGYTNIDSIKNSPSTIETVISDIKNHFHIYEQDDDFDKILNGILSSCEYTDKDELSAYMSNIIEDILNNLNRIKSLRERSDHHKKQMINIYRKKMALRRIYLGKNNNIKETIIRALQQDITDDNAPVVRITENIEMYGPEASVFKEKRYEKREAKVVGKAERNPEDVLFNNAKAEFNQMFSRSRDNIFEDILNKMVEKRINILHSDELELNTIKDFADLSILLKINPFKPLKINNLLFTADSSHRTVKKDWISFPAFYIEKIGE